MFVKKTLKRWLPERIQRILKKFRRIKEHPVIDVLNNLIKKESYVVMQIGSFIGDSENDPIYNFFRRNPNQNGQLILIEPIQEYFSQLVKNYNHLKNTIFINAAVSGFSGKTVIKRISVNPEDYGFPNWLKQVSSIKDERMKEMWDSYEKSEEIRNFFIAHSVDEVVDCCTVNEICGKNAVNKIDLLLIDAEGSELEIITAIDFLRINPINICYESVLLGENKIKLEEFLRKKNYKMQDYGQDTFAFKVGGVD